MPRPVSFTWITLSPSRRSNGIVDQISDCLEKQIAVTVDSRLVGNFDLKADTLVLGDRFVEVAHLAQQRGELDLTEAFEPAVMLDLGNTQQRRDNGQRLVETANRLVDNRA